MLYFLSLGMRIKMTERETNYTCLLEPMLISFGIKCISYCILQNKPKETIFVDRKDFVHKGPMSNKFLPSTNKFY